MSVGRRRSSWERRQSHRCWGHCHCRGAPLCPHGLDWGRGAIARPPAPGMSAPPAEHQGRASAVPEGPRRTSLAPEWRPGRCVPALVQPSGPVPSGLSFPEAWAGLCSAKHASPCRRPSRLPPGPPDWDLWPHPKHCLRLRARVLGPQPLASPDHPKCLSRAGRT